MSVSRYHFRRQSGTVQRDVDVDLITLCGTRLTCKETVLSIVRDQPTWVVGLG